MSQAFHGGRLREARAKFGDLAFLDFSVNTNAFWHPPATLPAVPLSDAITQYPEADAHSVGALLSELYEVHGGHLLPTAGAIEGLYLAARLFAGKRALLLTPCFADYARACAAAGLEVQTHSLLPDPPEPAEFIELARKMDVVVLGNPNNPTARLFPNLREIISRPDLSHLHWIVDEAFI
ncbi:MAG: aminotransferase class I/II-fold pyridoxal phosphate-dependent enzyme, partial [Verrucomicrobia bacterium]|nr:aminotransferase class I/II-fold pyridoxal phosphate-dependent enzyme [Verrucomicrobiota bacterium]